MTSDQFKSWLDAYGRAWETRNSDAVAELFTEDAVYQETPFVDPLRGRQAIRDYWNQVVVRAQEQIHFGYKILAVTAALGFARWWASFVRVKSETRVQLDGIFAISLNAENRCKQLQEWWHKQENQRRRCP